MIDTAEPVVRTQRELSLLASIQHYENKARRALAIKGQGIQAERHREKAEILRRRLTGEPPRPRAREGSRLWL